MAILIVNFQLAQYICRNSMIAGPGMCRLLSEINTVGNEITDIAEDSLLDIHDNDVCRAELRLLWNRST